MAARKAAPDAQSPRLSRGFTLVEIAVVLGIIALILGALLPLITAQTANARISTTRGREDAIRTALITFVARHGYLPCPADGWLLPGDPNYGHEARTPVTGLPASLACDKLSTLAGAPASSKDFDASSNPLYPSASIYRGVVPWLDLGLTEDSANDAWNRRISYIVSSVSVRGYGSREAASGLLGGLVVCDSYGSTSARLLTRITPVGTAAAVGDTPCTAPANSPLISTQSAAVALISHGENGYGAFVPPQGGTSGSFKAYAGSGQASDAEKANIELGRNVLVQAPYSRTFDDIVLWLTPADLVAPLIQSGALPSMQALMNRRFSEAGQAILASLLSGTTNASHAISGSSPTSYEYFLCPLVLDARTPDVSGKPLGLFADLFDRTPGSSIPAQLLPPDAATLSSQDTWFYARQQTVALTDDNLQRPGTVVPTLLASPDYDPWGNPILYTTTRATETETSAEVLTQNDPNPALADARRRYAYVLYSPGPDGVLGTLDDASVGVTFLELRNALQQARPLAQNRDGATPTCPEPPDPGG